MLVGVPSWTRTPIVALWRRAGSRSTSPYSPPGPASPPARVGPIVNFTYARSYLARKERISLYEPELPLVEWEISPRAGEIAGCIAEVGGVFGPFADPMVEDHQLAPGIGAGVGYATGDLAGPR